MNIASNKIINTMLELRRRRLMGRITYILLFFSNSIYKNFKFEIPISRKEIAEFIGKTTENVIKALSELRKNNIINISGKTIEIIDINKLQKISELS